MGLTLPTSCLAICQGLKIAHTGACQESDPLASGIIVPGGAGSTSEGGAAGGAAGRGAGGGSRPTKRRAILGEPGSSGTSAAGGSSGGSNGDVTARFTAEGFVYVGQVQVTDQGPSGVGPTGFVSSLSPGQVAEDASDIGPRSAEKASTLTTLQIRGVRVSADGALYLQSEPIALDIASLPTSGQTESKKPEEGTAATWGRWLQAGNQRQHQGQGAAVGSLAVDTGAVREADADPGGGFPPHSWSQLKQQRRRQLVDDSYRADVRVWPHSVIGQLSYRVEGKRYVCSGTWVTPYDVLTAAHCVFDLTSNVASRNFLFEPGKIGISTPEGSIPHSFVTFYRAEFPRGGGGGVNYFDVALVRMANRSSSYMGIKYSCDKIDYPKTQACGYAQINNGNYQQCDDCYYTSNACLPMIQPINWCYTVGGQSGSPIYDLADYHIVATLSGGLMGPEYADYSYWTPIDALHFTSLTRWMWQPGQPVGVPPAGDAPWPPLGPAAPTPPKSVGCLSSETGNVRLVEGLTEAMGRAEICHDQEWGLICSQYEAGPENAQVICRHLGYPSGSLAISESVGPFDPSQPTWLEPACNGTESRLDECLPLSAGAWHVGSQCPQPINVACLTENSQADSTPQLDQAPDSYPCGSEGAVRLRDSGEVNWGRVEYCSGGVWGSVCHDGWDDLDATVACRQLGYAYGIALPGVLRKGQSPPGPTSMRIWLQQVECTGTESQLSSCPTLVPLGATDCSHRADAGALCSLTPPPTAGVAHISTPKCTKPGALRVAGGGDAATDADIGGRLEVCYVGQWGAVCEKNFNFFEAQIACRQLGYVYGRVVPADPLPGQPIWMSDVRCDLASGVYTFWPARLTSCGFWGMEDVDCPYGAVAGVQCTNSTFSSEDFSCDLDGELRLRGGVSNNTGRLELCRDDMWGALCRQGFTPEMAGVACRQLGFSSGYILPEEAVPNGHPESPVWGDVMDCGGQEASLVDCAYDNGYYGFCDTQDRDVGLQCLETAHPPAAPPVIPEHHPAFRCITPGQIRLVDLFGRTSYDAGLLEICIDGLWGTVCNKGFGNEEAQVACRHYGFASGIVAPRKYGSGSSGMLVHMEDVDCTGSEERLNMCSYQSQSTCTHSSDVSVQCWMNFPPSPPAPETPTPLSPPEAPQPPRPVHTGSDPCSTAGSVRLMGGMVPDSGMLQYCSSSDANGAMMWGSVCGDEFRMEQAAMVCRQMGYKDGFLIPKPATPSYGFNGLYYTFNPNPSDMPVWLPNPLCLDDAKQLSDCLPSKPKCTHKVDVAVVCLQAIRPTRRNSCQGGSVRLVGGSGPNQGTVQACKNGLWGTVCDVDWDDRDAAVACRQAGYAGGMAVSSRGCIVNGSSYGPYPSGPKEMRIWFSNMQCTKEDQRLDVCQRATGPAISPECKAMVHRQDAGAVCWAGTRAG